MNTNQEFKGVTLLILGCGSRGKNYASYAMLHPDKARVVAISDPQALARKKFLGTYGATIDETKIFADWREILDSPGKLADCVVIALPDKEHKDAAIACTNKGYHMLLEKPMATSLDHCKQITMACREKKGQINAVCHVLRYFAPCLKIKEIIDSGVIGDVVNINHTEPVGYEHFAHSFVRGNWHNENDSSFSLLAKCCHDIDLIGFWMGDKKKFVKVSSFGSLMHFRKENAPKNSTEKCFDCPVEKDCCYSSKKIYGETFCDPNRWPISVVLGAEIKNLKAEDCSMDIEDILLKKSDLDKLDLLKKCLKHDKTNYGRCVYKMNNDVCDNQIVNMQFSDKSTATLNMIAFSQAFCQRKTTIYGTKGQLDWDDHKAPNQIFLFDFLSQQTSAIDCNNVRPESNKKISEVESRHLLSGHGGADYWLMQAFVEAVIQKDQSLVLTDVEDSLKSHLIVFAAECSRLEDKVIDIKEFCKENTLDLK